MFHSSTKDAGHTFHTYPVLTFPVLFLAHRCFQDDSESTVKVDVAWAWNSPSKEKKMLHTHQDRSQFLAHQVDGAAGVWTTDCQGHHPSGLPGDLCSAGKNQVLKDCQRVSWHFLGDHSTASHHPSSTGPENLTRQAQPQAQADRRHPVAATVK